MMERERQQKSLPSLSISSVANVSSSLSALSAHNMEGERQRELTAVSLRPFLSPKRHHARARSSSSGSMYRSGWYATPCAPPGTRVQHLHSRHPELQIQLHEPVQKHPVMRGARRNLIWSLRTSMWFLSAIAAMMAAILLPSTSLPENLSTYEPAQQFLLGARQHGAASSDERQRVRVMKFTQKASNSL